MKRNNKRTPGGFPKTLLLIWLGILAMGFLNRAPGLGSIFLLAFLYVIFMDRINEAVLTKTGKADKISDIEYNAYRAAIDGYQDTPTEYIAEKTGRDEEKVISDLLRLMDRRYFPGSYFDEKGNFIVPSNKKKRDDMTEEVEAAQIKCPYCGRKIPVTISFCYYCGKPLEIVRELETLRKQSMSAMKAVAKKLPEGADRETIEKIAALTGKIIRKYEEEPDRIKDSAKFREYYLPKTVSAVEYYGKLSDLEELTDTEAELKEQIEETMKTIEDAFSNILHKLSVDGIYDLSTDVTVLESVLERDGLIRSPFDIEK